MKDELADAIREFNEVVRKDPRVDVVALPFRDGVSIITRRCVHINSLHEHLCSDSPCRSTGMHWMF